MASQFEWGTTKMWRCDHCGALNFTSEADLFSDQCRNCTIYNEVDWTAEPDVTLEEAARLSETVEGE